MLKQALLSVMILVGVASCQSQHQQTKSDKDLSHTSEKQEEPPYKDLSVKKAKELMSQNPDIIILDVRTPEEVAEGAIQGAINIDVKNPEFVNKIQKLEKDKAYLVYCRSGRRSLAAIEIMNKAGFGSLSNMVGGYEEFKNSR